MQKRPNESDAEYLNRLNRHNVEAERVSREREALLIQNKTY
jgi:hypothetical protein